MLREKKGNSILSTPIMIAVGIAMLATIMVFAIEIIMPYLWYEKLSSTSLSYVFIMEEYGYLTNEEKKNLIQDLIEQGFEKNKIRVECTSQIQEYGAPIFLKIEYDYSMKLWNQPKRIVKMKVNRSSVSKR